MPTICGVLAMVGTLALCPPDSLTSPPTSLSPARATPPIPCRQAVCKVGPSLGNSSENSGAETPGKGAPGEACRGGLANDGPALSQTRDISCDTGPIAGGFQGPGADPTPPSDHIPLGRRCVFQVEKFGSACAPRPTLRRVRAPSRGSGSRKPRNASTAVREEIVTLFLR